MLQIRPIVLAGTVVVLAISLVGAITLAAPKGELSIINGWPGKRVDVCVNGVEIKSGLRYGGKTFKQVGVKKQTVKFFNHRPARCGGGLVGKRFLPGDPDGVNVTVVLTRNAPMKVLAFDNRGLHDDVLSAGDASALAWRHAATLGFVNWRYLAVDPTPEPLDPAATGSPPAVWRKGNQYLQPLDAGWDIRVRVTRPNKLKAIAASKLRTYRAGKRNEEILVGSNARNARIVSLARPMPTPTGTPAP